jgi:selenocysteine-specific elongation factor
MRSIIVGTAGHIDHGKTALVRALTGVDADRLPEEKLRGITIDLGFAELDLGDVRLGFVDVPGHERFVKNMLAGAHGIDLVALVIAADEGVMPQTREHFDICRLLHIKSGLIIITKSDKVDEELLELVRDEAEELVAGTFLEGAPIVAVSSRTGAGVEQLKDTLREIALNVPERLDGTVARLPVDRSFTIRGFGAVVTGTLVAGSIAEGDEMELLPAGIRVRVRGLQVHGNAVGRAEAGQRTAANLGGTDTAAIERGMTLAPAGRLSSTQIIDAHVDVLASAPRPLRSRVRVRVHLGTAEVLARIQVLECGSEIAPGASGLVQLRMETPVVALLDERFIIRSYSPSRTIAGGRVLDPSATKHRGREVNAANARLTLLMSAERSEQLALFADGSRNIGLRKTEVASRTGWTDEVLADAVAKAVESGEVIDAEDVYISRVVFDSMAAATTDEVAKHHRSEPLSRGLPRETLRERLFASVSPGVFRAVLAHLEKTGTLTSEREVVRTVSHKLTLSPSDTAIKDHLEATYREAALEAPSFEETLEQASSARATPAHARTIFQLLVEAGTLVRVGNDLFFHKEALDGLFGKLSGYAASHEPERLIDVATFKDLAGVSRKYAIPLLEYLDRERITRRAGDKRIIL